jgi:hypothetical protein
MNKKILLSGLLALALLVAAGYGVNQKVKSNANLSDLALANVEALAQSENGGSYSCESYCKVDPDWICKIYSNGILMNTCSEHRKK